MNAQKGDTDVLANTFVILAIFTPPKNEPLNSTTWKMKGPEKKRGTSSQACRTIRFLGFHSFSKVTRWVFFLAAPSTLMTGTISSVGKQVQGVEVSLQESWGSVLSISWNGGNSLKLGQRRDPELGLIYDLRTGPKFMLWLKFACDSSEVWMMLLFDFEILRGRISMLFCLMDVSWSSYGSWCIETCF